MTDNEARALGLRWLKAGLQATYRRESVPDRSYRDVRGVLWRIDAAMWPDLRDDATRGVLLGQVRRVYGLPLHAADSLARRGWVVWDLSKAIAQGSTEEEALVVALERGQG